MLEIKDLSIKTKNKKDLLGNISLTIDKEHVIGITGKSGSGKTTLIKSVLGILDNYLYEISGSICLDNKTINNLSTSERRELCGRTIGYIPQNPMTAFDPRIKIGKQIEETLCIRLGIKRKEAVKVFLAYLEKLNLYDGERILGSYPSEISGGMLQRIAVAFVFSLKPKYILADEPTSALDEENRDILIKVLKDKKNEIGILFVSHDIKSLSELCENVIVMEDGKIIEKGNMDNLLNHPKTNWTKTFSGIYKNSMERSFLWMK